MTLFHEIIFLIISLFTLSIPFYFKCYIFTLFGLEFILCIEFVIEKYKKRKELEIDFIKIK